LSGLSSPVWKKAVLPGGEPSAIKTSGAWNVLPE